MAGSVSRHAVYTPFGVALLIACVLALAVALWQGAARVAPSRPAVLAALALAVVGQVIKPPYMNVVDRNGTLRAGIYVCIAVTVLAAVAAAAPAAHPGRRDRGRRRPRDRVRAGGSRGEAGHRRLADPARRGPRPGRRAQPVRHGLRRRAGRPGERLLQLPARDVPGAAAGAAAVRRRAVRGGRGAAGRRGRAGLAGRPQRPAAARSRWRAGRRRCPARSTTCSRPGTSRSCSARWPRPGCCSRCAGRGGRRPCFAVALCTKQHVVLLLPLWALWPAFGPRRALGAAAGAAAVTLPFFLWNPGRFWHCVVEFFVDLPARTDSLSIWQLGARAAGDRHRAAAGRRRVRAGAAGRAADARRRCCSAPGWCWPRSTWPTSRASSTSGCWRPSWSSPASRSPRPPSARSGRCRCPRHLPAERSGDRDPVGRRRRDGRVGRQVRGERVQVDRPTGEVRALR